ncbi:phosphoglycerate mutase [Stenotrophomonas sp. PS02289]|uniref:phosphoglycerate mutase n=1 Tax=Stenotrophomonas sp. PS02289 TaxID=2991422 RepID=UPI00249AB59E|nr:phosphoglycerate mutase [Stenotrophomonas sp. PS02289]
MASATLLLPARSRFPAAPLPDDVARALGRAQRSTVEPGERAQLQRHFQLQPAQWPVAALTRQLDVGDAADGVWLRADPANVAPDMQGARMMGHGDTLRPDPDDVAALLPALQPLFAGYGFTLDAPVPGRWYLRLPEEIQLPTFAAPDDVLGDDLFDHLPPGDTGRLWRALLTEAQVVLHQHEWNARRIAAGKRAINSLWFWGGGVLPHSVSTDYAQVRSREALLQGLAKAAGVAVGGDQPVDALVDLRQLRSLEQLGNEAIRPLLAALQRGELRRLVLDFEDGLRFELDKSQRWKLWKKPLQLQDA